MRPPVTHVFPGFCLMSNALIALAGVPILDQVEVSEYGGVCTAKFWVFLLCYVAAQPPT